MKLTKENKLELFYSRDKSANGKFITGVLTTGIYCLPSCTARKPKPENIRFFDTEADAIEFGLRACKRCKPDLYYKNINPDEVLIDEAYSLIQNEPEKWGSIEIFSKYLKVGKTKLSKLFRDYYQTSFTSVLQKARIKKARDLLLNSEMDLLEISELSGYDSSSSFHKNFREITGLSPKEYRRLNTADSFTVKLPEDYRADLLIRHHSWEGDGPDHELIVEDSTITITKAITLTSSRFILKITLEGSEAECRILERSVGDPPMVEVHNIAQKLLGLIVNPSPFETRVLANSKLAPLIKNRIGMRIPQTATLYEGIVWVIVGQAVSVAAAKSLRTKLIKLVNAGSDTILIYHPSPDEVSKLSIEDLRSCGFSYSKANYLLDITGKILDKSLDMNSLHELNSVKLESELTSLRGFGPWSVNYLMMRCLGLVDCVPLGDTGLVAGLKAFFKLDHKPDRKEVVKLMERFAPFRSLATFHLWMGLDD